MTMNLMMVIGAAGDVRFHRSLCKDSAGAFQPWGKHERRKWMFNDGYCLEGDQRLRCRNYWTVRSIPHIKEREEALSRVDYSRRIHLPLVTAHPWMCNITDIKWYSITNTFSPKERIKYTHKIRLLT